MRKKESNRQTLRWLFKVTGRNKVKMVFLLLVQVILGISSVGFAWLLRGVIDSAVIKDTRGFYLYAVFLAVLTFCQILLRAADRFLSESSRSSLENCFKSRLFHVLLERDYASVTAVHSGEWMNRLTSDTAVAADGMTSILPGLAGMTVKLAGALALILALVPAFTWVLLPGSAFLIVFTYTFRKVLKKLHRRVQEADGRLRVFLSERLSSLLIVRAFAHERQTVCEAEEKMEDHKRARMQKNHFSNLCNAGFVSVVRGVYVLGAVYCGYGILMDTISYGTFTAVIQLIGQIQSPFANITGFLPQYYAVLASAERLMEAEDYAEDCGKEMLTEAEIQSFYEREFAAIGLEHASFTYLPPVRGREEVTKERMPVVVHDLKLQIRKGEYIAFTGPSGCGKSTILKLLMCLYPLDSGERYLLGKDGTRLKLTGSYRTLFAYVPQGNQLMSGTIREIVAFGDLQRMENEPGIWKALSIACAEEYVRELKDGIDTMLGEHGLGLSEGQMQRIAIARAVFSGNPVLLLDESTSALDTESEQRLLSNLRSMTDRTVLIVTHRPAVLKICDRQAVVTEKGIRMNEWRKPCKKEAEEL